MSRFNARTTKREDIYAAIFAQVEALKDAGTIKDCSRVLQHWDDLSASQMPFVCAMQMPETLDYQLGSGKPTKLRGEVALLVYCGVGSDKEIVATQLNEVVDALEEAFMPADARGDGRNTLNGLVYDCRAVGSIELDEGTLGTQAVAIVHVNYLVG